MAERKIVAKKQEAHAGGSAQEREQPRQARQVLALQLDDLQVLAHGADLGMDRLDETRLAHAARAPQERVVGGQAAGELERVFKKDRAGAVDADQKRQIHPVDALDRDQPIRRGLPDEGLRSGEIGHHGGAGRDAFKRVGDAAEIFGGDIHHAVPALSVSFASSSSSSPMARNSSLRCRSTRAMRKIDTS